MQAPRNIQGAADWLERIALIMSNICFTIRSIRSAVGKIMSNCSAFLTGYVLHLADEDPGGLQPFRQLRLSQPASVEVVMQPVTY